MPDKKAFNPEEFRKDVINAMGANALAMSSFVRVADIQFDTSVPTAAISLDGLPVIHVNPDFVEKYATTPEHRFVLIYHELLHMILGHGVKIKDMSDNVIADALINSIICCQYPQARYTRFFTNFYDAKKFPDNILRPYSKFDKFTHRQKYRKLYSFSGMSWQDLRRWYDENTKEAGKPLETPTLLGTHGKAKTEGSGEVLLPIADGIRKSIENAIREEVEKEQNRIRQKYYRRSNPDFNKMEKELQECTEQGFSNSVFLRAITRMTESVRKKSAIEKVLLAQSKQSLSSRVETAIRGMFPKIPLMTPIPNFRDRYAIAAQQAGVYRPFYKNPLLPRDYGACSIYVDVSESMGNYMRLVYKVAVDCKDYLDDKIFLFSNVIEPITKNELLKGVVKSTGGTDFNIIISHMEKNKIKKAVLFTDGWAGINKDGLRSIEKHGLSIICVLTPHGTEANVKKMSKQIIKIEEGDIK
jgi:hypothetical protein